MEKSISLAKPLNNIIKTRSFVERYFTTFTTPDKVYLNMHSNRIVLLGLTKDHDIFTLNKKIVKIDLLFKHDKHDLKNLVQGKKKRGGIHVTPSMKLFNIVCDDESSYVIRSPLRGSLIEINFDILNGDLSCVQNKPESDGFLVILNLPSFEYNIEKALSSYNNT